MNKQTGRPEAAMSDKSDKAVAARNLTESDSRRNNVVVVRSNRAPEARPLNKVEVMELARSLVVEGDLLRGDLAVVEYLAEITDKDTGAATVEVQTIADRLACSRPTIVRALKRLVEAEVITRTPKRKGLRCYATEYRLKIIVPEVSQPKCTDAPPPVHQCTTKSSPRVLSHNGPSPSPEAEADFRNADKQKDGANGTVEAISAPTETTAPLARQKESNAGEVEALIGFLCARFRLKRDWWQDDIVKWCMAFGTGYVREGAKDILAEGGDREDLRRAMTGDKRNASRSDKIRQAGAWFAARDADKTESPAVVGRAPAPPPDPWAKFWDRLERSHGGEYLMSSFNSLPEEAKKEIKDWVLQYEGFEFMRETLEDLVKPALRRVEVA